MKIVVTTILFLYLQSNTIFLNRVLNNFDRYSYFIVLNIETTRYSGAVLIENDDLYYYYARTQKLDKVAYRKLMHDILTSQRLINLKKLNLEKWEFQQAPSVPHIEATSKQGLDVLLQKYFDGRVIKDGVTDEEKLAIISALYHWKITVKIDDETGYLLIDNA